MSPKSQEYDVAPVDVFAKVTTFPLVVKEPAAVGAALNVTLNGVEVPTPLHAMALVVVTVMLLVVEVTMMLWVVSPVDQT